MFALPDAMSKAAVRNYAWILAAAVGALTSHGPSSLAKAAQHKPSGPAASRPAVEQYRHYQVAAGTALFLKLITPLHPGTAVVDGQVAAALWTMTPEPLPVRIPR